MSVRQTGRDPFESKRIELFWSKVLISNRCWEWAANRSGKGNYGYFWNGSKLVRAHRYSYELEYGPIDPPSLFVLHKCDNPACVRPDHLFLGTNSDNVRDMHRKNRGYCRSTVADACRKGHPYTDGSYQIQTKKDGRWWRACLVCIAENRARNIDHIREYQKNLARRRRAEARARANH